MHSTSPFEFKESQTTQRRNSVAVQHAVVVPAITASVHFAVDKLSEIDDEVLVLARSKPEVENALDVDRFYEHLHVCAKQC
jgi:hypothetical protein